MTEELEQKLSELLGLKKQLEEITAEKQKEETSSVIKRYKKEARLIVICYAIAITFGMAMVIFGAVVYLLTHDVIYVDSPTIIVAGLIFMMVAKLAWIIRRCKLAIMYEIKRSELRITELLKK